MKNATSIGEHTSEARPHSNGLLACITKTVENTKGRNKVLFCDQSRDGSCSCLPVCKSKRSKDNADETTNSCKQGEVHDVRRSALNAWKVTKDAICALPGCPTKVGKNPDTNSCCEDDGTSLKDVCRDTLPNMHCPRLDRRHVVIRKLHNKWCRLALKCLSLLQHDCRNNNHCNAKEVESRSNPPSRRATNKNTHNQSNDWLLCRARNHGGEHCSHTAVLLVLNGTSRENTRNATAGRNQKWNEGLAGQAKATEHAVHNKGNTAHVTAVLKEAQHDKQNKHLWDKAKDRANAADNTVNYKASDNGACASTFKSTASKIRNTWDIHAVLGSIWLSSSAFNSSLKASGSYATKSLEFLTLSKNWLAISIKLKRIVVSINEVAILVMNWCAQSNNVLLGSLCLKAGDSVRIPLFSFDCSTNLSSINTSLVSCVEISVNLVTIVMRVKLIFCLIVLGVADTHEVETLVKQVVVDPVSCSRTNSRDGDEVHKSHDDNEDWKTEDTVSNNAVNLLGSGQLLWSLLDTSCHDASNPLITVRSDDGLSVVVTRLLNCSNNLLKLSGLLGRKVKRSNCICIALKDLNGVPTRKSCRSKALDCSSNLAKSLFNLWGKALNTLSRSSLLTGLNCRLYQSVNVLVAKCGNLNNLNTKLLGKHLGINDVTGLLEQVNHVKTKDNWTASLKNLSSQIEVTLQVGNIEKVNNGVWALINEVVTRYLLLR